MECYKNKEYKMSNVTLKNYIHFFLKQNKIPDQVKILKLMWLFFNCPSHSKGEIGTWGFQKHLQSSHLFIYFIKLACTKRLHGAV